MSYFSRLISDFKNNFRSRKAVQNEETEKEKKRNLAQRPGRSGMETKNSNRQTETQRQPADYTEVLQRHPVQKQVDARVCLWLLRCHIPGPERPEIPYRNRPQKGPVILQTVVRNGRVQHKTGHHGPKMQDMLNKHGKLDQTERPFGRQPQKSRLHGH